MAYTQAQLFALESALALGVTEVQYPDGTRKQYRTLDEMRSLRREMRRELGITTSTNTSTRRYAEFSRGLD